MKKFNKRIPIIILAGGKGERFVSKENFPKQLAKVSNHPIIIEIILYYYKNGFNFFILPLGYKKKLFTQFFLDKKNINKYNFNILKQEKLLLNNSKINILFFDAGIKSNKLERIYKSIKFCKLSDKLIGICYGDIFANISFDKQLKLLNDKSNQGVLVGYNEYSPYGHLKLFKNKILGFREKPVLKDPINIGFYFFNKKTLSKIRLNKKKDFETDFLPKLAKNKKLVCYMHKGYHFTVNTQKDLVNVKKMYRNNKNLFKKL